MLALLRTRGKLRRFLLCEAQSDIGTMLAYPALLVVALDRGGSAWAVTLVLLADFAPELVLGPLFGALADRVPRGRCIVFADLLRAGAFAALPFVSSLGATAALALAAGIGGALYRPASMAALPALAGERAERAVSIQVALWSFAGVAGPALGAVLIAASSVYGALEINAASFVISALVMGGLALPAAERADAGSGEKPKEGERVGDGVRAGLRAARGIPGLTALVVCMSIGALFAALINVAEPLLVRDDLGGSSASLAALIALYGLGMVAGAAVRGTGPAAFARLAGAGVTLGGVATIAIAGAPTVLAAAPLFVAAGIGNALSVGSERKFIQATVPDAMLSRVFGAHNALQAGALSLAMVAGGALTAMFGAQGTFALAGVGALAVGLVMLTLLRSIRTATALTDG